MSRVSILNGSHFVVDVCKHTRTERERERERERETQRERHTDRQTDSETERDRETEREKERERKIGVPATKIMCNTSNNSNNSS